MALLLLAFSFVTLSITYSLNRRVFAGLADEPLAAPKMLSDNRLSVRLTHRLSSSFVLEAGFDASPGFTMILGPSGGAKRRC